MCMCRSSWTAAPTCWRIICRRTGSPTACEIKRGRGGAVFGRVLRPYGPLPSVEITRTSLFGMPSTPATWVALERGRDVDSGFAQFTDDPEIAPAAVLPGESQD